MNVDQYSHLQKQKSEGGVRWGEGGKGEVLRYNS